MEKQGCCWEHPLEQGCCWEMYACVSGVFVRERLQELRGLFNSSLLLAHEAKRVGGLWSQISVDQGKHSSQCKDLKTLFNTAWKAEKEGVTGCGSQKYFGLESKHISWGQGRYRVVHPFHVVMSVLGISLYSSHTRSLKRTLKRAQKGQD